MVDERDPDPTPYDATFRKAGQEVSSTNEGRYISVLESLIDHPAHADWLVDKGDPLSVGWDMVGIALKSATSATDFIPIDTEGIWFLMVEATWANIDVGDVVFIDPFTAALSDDFEDIPFGHALGGVALGATSLIAVKVHAMMILFPWWLLP